jgi:hypothetical protein
MERPVHRLVVWQRRLLYGASAVLLLTGAAWLTIHYGRAADALPSPLEAWLIRAHALASYAALFSFGVLAASHIPQGWRFTELREWAGQRSTGTLLCTLAGLLALSAYVLSYLASESMRPALGWAHSGLGAAMAVLLLVHRRNA